MKEHPNFLKLNNYINGFDVREEIKNHIETCDGCKLKLEKIKENQENIMLMKNPEIIAKDIIETMAHEKQNKKKWFLLPAFATTTALLIIVIFFGFQKTEDNIRLKGNISASVQVERDGKIIKPHDNFLYKPRDKIILDLITPENGFISVYYEEDRKIVPVAEMQNIAIMGKEILKIQGKLELECESDQEKLHLYFHDKPIEKQMDESAIHEIIELKCE